MKDRPRIIQYEWVNYKLNRVIPSEEEDNHHIISRKEKARFKVWESENIVRIKRKTHVALNNLFENRQEPRKQLQMMYEIWKTALSPWVRQELDLLINLPDDMFYNENLLNGKHKRRQWEKDL